MFIWRNAPAIINNGDLAICAYVYFYFCAIWLPVWLFSHKFIDCIVNNFINQVVQASLVSTTNVHSRPFPNSLHSFKYLYIRGGVVAIWFSFSVSVAISHIVLQKLTRMFHTNFTFFWEYFQTICTVPQR